ncbi:hypothetical protein [Streptomyces sp. NPDC012825]|uniref:hypothetical protein n=1 Tax=Streptomyces sp. NPDC012825 TaxID=3364851 RepID=UPI0036C3E524
MQGGAVEVLQDVGQLLVVLDEQPRDEVQSGEGEGFGGVRAGRGPGAQGGHEDAAEGVEGEGVVARFRREFADRGDGDDDPLDDVHDQLGHLRFGGRELVGELGVVDADRPQVVEDVHHRLRGHRDERYGSGVLGHLRLLDSGPPR